VTEAVDKMTDEEDDGNDDEDDNDANFDTVFAECKKQYEEHIQQLIAILPFVLRFKDYSIDSGGRRTSQSYGSELLGSASPCIDSEMNKCVNHSISMLSR
jgi:hypothetical protein